MSAWPALREELGLYEGPAAPDGAPTWSLHDPVRNRFFRLDWVAFEILLRWPLADAERIASAIGEQTPLSISPEEVQVLQEFLGRNELLQQHAPGTAIQFGKLRAQRHQGLWHWLLHHYLFFRIPLIHPDAWLERHLDRVRFLSGRGFLWLTLLALVFGLFEVGRQWQSFASSFVDLFSWQGLAAWGVTLVLVKVLHELGHGFVAKSFGCRVPTMGVAFLVLFPMAYTDVNEAWKLKSRRQRLFIGAAGIATELIIAVWATLAWSLLPDGQLRTMAFLLATTTWVSTLAINTLPFMRFDGYFLLTDWLNMPNLHARAFALARWDLRERLFGLGEVAPEQMPIPRRRGLILFAWVTWIYRLFLFIGIALLVYHWFTKLLGIFLFAVEIAWFILRPLSLELKAWRERWPRIRQGARSRRTGWILLALSLLVVIPWYGQISATALLKPTQSHPLVAHEPGLLEDLPIANGSKVTQGAPLLRIVSPSLEDELTRVQQRLATQQLRLQQAPFSAKTSEQIRVIEEEVRTLEDQHKALRNRQGRLSPRAPFDGVVVGLHPDMGSGVPVGRNERLGRLEDRSQWQVVAYLREQEVDRLSPGSQGAFYPETPGEPVIPIRVSRIDRDATRQIPEALLTSAHGGTLPVRETSSGSVPEYAVYRLTLVPLNAPVSTTLEQRGQVVIGGDARSLAGEFLTTAASVIVRELSF